MVEDRKLLRVWPDVANALGVGRSMAYQLAPSIGIVRINSAVRVPAGALDRWLEQREKEAIEAAATHQADRPEA